MFTLSTLVGLALIPIYLSPFDFAFYFAAVVFIVIGLFLVIRHLKRVGWPAYGSVLLISIGAASIAVDPLSSLLPGPAADNWPVLLAVVGTWLVAPVHWFAVRSGLEEHTIRLQLETLYFKTLTGQLAPDLDPIDRLAQIWHPHWRRRVYGSVWVSIVLFWKNRRFLDSVRDDQVESLLAAWLIEGYPEDLRSFAKRKGVIEGKDAKKSE